MLKAIIMKSTAPYGNKYNTRAYIVSRHFAAHPQSDYNGSIWKLTHIKSGYCVCRKKTRTELVKVAAALEALGNIWDFHFYDEWEMIATSDICAQCRAITQDGSLG